MENLSRGKGKGYVETLCHRNDFLPRYKLRNAIVRGYRNGMQSMRPFKGVQFDIIKIAMVHIYRRFKEEGLSSQMILQVTRRTQF